MANIIYKTCVCGQRFGSEGELARHQKTCPHYRRAQVDAELVDPLRKEALRLNGEADGIYVGIAQAFGQYALGDTGEAKYRLKVARDQHEHAIGSGERSWGGRQEPRRAGRQAANAAQRPDMAVQRPEQPPHGDNQAGIAEEQLKDESRRSLRSS